MDDRIKKQGKSHYGKLMGYGWCTRCKLAWNVVEGFMISYTQSYSMFPICERCFDEATLSEINGYIDELVGKWEFRNKGLTHDGLTYEEIKANAKSSAKFLKGK